VEETEIKPAIGEAPLVDTLPVEEAMPAVTDDKPVLENDKPVVEDDAMVEEETRAASEVNADENDEADMDYLTDDADLNTKSDDHLAKMIAYK